MLSNNQHQDDLTDFPSIEMIRERRNSTPGRFLHPVVYGGDCYNHNMNTNQNSHNIVQKADWVADTLQQQQQHPDTTRWTTTSIIVKGLPADMTEREFVNMFCFADGFEGGYLLGNSTGGGVSAGLQSADGDAPTMPVHQPAAVGSNFISIGMPNIWTCHQTDSTLSTRSPSPTNGHQQLLNQNQQSLTGTARFVSAECAIRAKNHLQGLCLDGPFVLHVELLPFKPQSTHLYKQDHHRRHSLFTPTNGPFTYPAVGGNRYQQLLMMSGLDPSVSIVPPMQHQMSNPNTTGIVKSKQMVIQSENPPCNTLYVGNLPPSACEDELRMLFMGCLGFKRLSFRHKPNGPMCFVEFDDINYATAAMEQLYGTMLSCSTVTKGGIRLSYSKNPLGVRSGVVSSAGISNGAGINNANSANNATSIIQNTKFTLSPSAINPPNVINLQSPTTLNQSTTSTTSV